MRGYGCETNFFDEERKEFLEWVRNNKEFAINYLLKKIDLLHSHRLELEKIPTVEGRRKRTVEILKEDRDERI